MMGASDTNEPIAAWILSNPRLEMLAREYPWATFSAAHWRKVENALAAVDVDLDAATVDELAGPRDWWGWKPGKGYTPGQVRLREALQEWAYLAAMAHGKKLPTPNERAEEIRKEVATLAQARAMLEPRLHGEVLQEWAHIAAIGARDNALRELAEEIRKELATLAQARAMLDPENAGPGLPTEDALYARIKRRRALQAAMTEEIAERREYITKLEAEGSSSKYSARTEANTYWDTQGKLWLNVTKGQVSKHRQKYLHNFLEACSQPLLPMLIEKAEQKLSKKELERELGRRLSNFVGNFLRKPKADESPESADV
jgi:hypothetical protein